MSAGQVELEFMLGANEKNTTVTFKAAAATAGVQPCVVNDLDLDALNNENSLTMAESTSAAELSVYVLDRKDGQGGSPDNAMDLQLSYIKPAEGWANAPKDAKEFVLL